MFLAILFSSPIATAQQPARSGADPAKLAREWADKGKTRFDKGDYAGAIEALNEAEKHLHAPTFIHYSALAHEKLGKLREARRLHQSVAEATLPPGSPKAWASAQQESAKAVQALDRRIPMLEILIVDAQSLNPRVTLDGVPLDARHLGRPTPQDPGKHTLVVEATGRGKVVRELALKEQTTEQVKVQLPPAGPTAPLGRAEAAASRSRQPSGPVQPGTRAAPAAPPVSERDARATAGYAAFGVGGAALVAGLVAGGIALGKRDDARIECGPDFDANRCRADRSGALGEAHTAAGVSNVGFLLAGAGAAAGAVLVALPKLAPRSRVVARGSLITVEGAF